MPERYWLITVEKLVDETFTGETTELVRATVGAPTAQQACKHLVDLTTNNARVVKFTVEEVRADIVSMLTD